MADWSSLLGVGNNCIYILSCPTCPGKSEGH
jgi:hypothetical protein